MSELLRQYFNIAFLMGRPQDVPPGRQVLQTGVLLAFITYVVALLDLLGLAGAVMHALADIGCTGLALYVALVLAGREARFEQAFGAYCGASAFINAAAIPIYLNRGPPGDEGVAGSLILAEFVLLVWGLSLLAHVIRHTFELRLPVSVLIAFGWVMLLLTLMGSLFAMPETAPDELSSVFDRAGSSSLLALR